MAEMSGLTGGGERNRIDEKRFCSSGKALLRIARQAAGRHKYGNDSALRMLK
jgi:hypothetical protein